MRDRALMAICAAVIIATAVGLIASRPRGRERISGPICGRVGYPHYASQKITEAEMWKRARFRILEPKVPEGWHLVEIRQMRGEDLQGFVLYYDTLQSQMDDVRANGKSRIFSVLNPEQRRKFEKMASEVKTRRRDAQSGKD